MSAADPATLAAIQRVTKRCLAEIDRVCTLLDLRYVAYGGTAIGAVRHKGFIPWDDDGDVCMPREDYERFIAEAPALLGDEFFIASPATHPNYPISFGVLGLKGSEFVSKVAKDRSFRMPIGVDLFVLDEIADDPGRFRAQSRGTWLWARLMFLHSIPNPPTGLPTPARQLASAAMACAHWGMRALCVNEASLYRRWLRAALKGRENPQKAADGSILFGDFSTRDPFLSRTSRCASPPLTTSCSRAATGTTCAFRIRRIASPTSPSTSFSAPTIPAPRPPRRPAREREGHHGLVPS